jgi:hypothetical protein
MPITPLDTSQCLLSYGISSTPDPIGISPGIATVSIVVSNTGDTVIHCGKIVVGYLAGTLAQDLTDNPGLISTVVAPDSWEVITTAPGLITFGTTSGDAVKITKEGLLFQLAGIAVNDQVGTTVLTITEWSYDEGTGPVTPHANEYQLSKFPYQWFMSDFAPLSPQADSQGQATLSWSASPPSDVAAYYLYYGDQGPIPVPATAPPYTTPPLTADTTFVLQAKVQLGGQTVEHYLTTSVSVPSPQLDAASLDVAGQASFQDGIGVTGNMTATGEVQAASAAVTGSVTAGGLLTASGPVSVLGAAQFIAAGSYTAHTDGFLIGTIQGKQTSGPRTQDWIFGGILDDQGDWLVSTGATGTSIAPAQDGTALVGSFTLPVPRGATFTAVLSTTPTIADVAFWWMPAGGIPFAESFSPAGILAR